MTTPTYGNCLTGLIYLLLRGRLSGFAMTSSGTWWLPIHLVGLTPEGALHFVHSDEIAGFPPLWFSGQFVGVARRDWDEALSINESRCYFKIYWR